MQAVINCVSDHVPRIHELLTTASDDSMDLTFGRLDPPFGFKRMKVLEV